MTKRSWPQTGDPACHFVGVTLGMYTSVLSQWGTFVWRMPQVEICHAPSPAVQDSKPRKVLNAWFVRDCNEIWVYGCAIFTYTERLHTIRAIEAFSRSWRCTISSTISLQLLQFAHSTTSSPEGNPGSQWHDNRRSYTPDEELINGILVVNGVSPDTDIQSIIPVMTFGLLPQRRLATIVQVRRSYWKNGRKPPQLSKKFRNRLQHPLPQCVVMANLVSPFIPLC